MQKESDEGVISTKIEKMLTVGVSRPIAAPRDVIDPFHPAVAIDPFPFPSYPPSRALLARGPNPVNVPQSSLFEVP